MLSDGQINKGCCSCFWLTDGCSGRLLIVLKVIHTIWFYVCNLRREQSALLDLFGLSHLSSVIDLTTFHALLLQVSLRYHCRLYNEWRQTNQRVVLLLPKSHSDSLGNPSVTGLLSVKRPSKESIVWLCFSVYMNSKRVYSGLSSEGPWTSRRNSDTDYTDSLVGF